MPTHDKEDNLKISFNLRLRYNEAKDCTKFIKTIGGDGGIIAGGSYFTGSHKILYKLLQYMDKKGYDTESLPTIDYHTIIDGATNPNH